MRKIFRGVAIAVPLLALASLPLWQQERIRALTVESANLREQLENATSAREQAEALLKLERKSRKRFGDSPQLELLRLRGQVGVLRRELAEVVRGEDTQKGPLGTEFGSSALTPSPGSEEIPATVLDFTEKLAAEKEKLVVARKKVTDLASTLGVSEDISSLDPTAALGWEDLKSYWPYFEAKSDLETRERFTRLFETKLLKENAGAQLPTRTP